MHHGNKENIELYKYELAISTILNEVCGIGAAATNYEVDVDDLTMFMHTIITKGKVIKGENKTLTHTDELAFLLYAKMCPQKHCVCLTCFKEYLPRLFCEFVNKNDLIHPQFSDIHEEMDECFKTQFLERNENEILKLFSRNCLITNNPFQKLLSPAENNQQRPSTSKNLRI